jgi:EAL and modified HD-GYP domain-containing signal transduction protein
MTPEMQPQASSTESATNANSDLRYVARQPILDARDRVLGYELLFWDGNDRVTLAKSDQAYRSLLDNTVLFGLDQLSGGLPAFVHCTADSLTDEWMHLLPPGLTVIELKADVVVDGDLLVNCRKMKFLGYRIAVDGFTGQEALRSLIDLADFVKIDMSVAGADLRRQLVEKLAEKPGRAIATNVQTQEQQRAALAEGFSFFQGYYFCHPEMLDSPRIPANRMVHLEILELVQQEVVDLYRLSQLVSCDASLTYRLLRLVNSPLCALRQEVTSIQSALMLIGERTFRHIAMLAIASDFSAGQPAEVLRMAFERGRFCEQAAGLCGLMASEQYLIGLVSMFPAMLRLEMKVLTQSLPLREKARQALEGAAVREGILLQWLLHQEKEEWPACDALLRTYNLSGEQVMRCRAEAIAWADAALSAAGSGE